ncbi:uncharacterized protein FRV6_16646 [Fusarium oxysporum]|uniref:Uncharacterized protein n=1 Tax=Fusarium oxysporum TaxID=5507 RepID=A0A2H3TV73_FUSOX|nr:uncharacterized protein FRV6_16646 [Fusarium oxysporum]
MKPTDKIQRTIHKADKGISAQFTELTKFLSTVHGDLANVTAPPFFLAPSSVVENPKSWAQRPAVFTAAAIEPESEKRSLLVLQMFLVALRDQLYVAGAPNGALYVNLADETADIEVGTAKGIVTANRLVGILTRLASLD